MIAGLSVLTYHSLDESGSVISTDPGWFRRTMERLASSGWRCHDLAEWVAAGRPAVDRGFAITFDDGLATILEGVDVLDRLGFPATIFLVTGRIGLENDWPGQPKKVPRQRLLDSGEIASLRAAGFRFGAHSRTHPRLDSADEDALDREIAGSKADVEDLCGAACSLFAHPYGASSRRGRVVANRHFSACFGTNPGTSGGGDPIDDLPRIDACDLRTPDRLDSLLAGRLASALRLRWAARRFKFAAKGLGGSSRMADRPAPEGEIGVIA